MPRNARTQRMLLALGVRVGLGEAPSEPGHPGAILFYCLLVPEKPPSSVLLCVTQSFGEIGSPGPAEVQGALLANAAWHRGMALCCGLTAEDAIHCVATRWRSGLLFLRQKTENTSNCYA